MFETYSAAQYRALDDTAFVARKQEVIGLLNADTLPEGVTDDMLFAEADLIEADEQRRNRAANLRNSSLTAVAQGAGSVVASSMETEQRSTIQLSSNESYTDSTEYRRALANSIMTRTAMPADILAKARQSRSAGDPVSVSFPDGYTNMTDPTFTTNVSTAIPIPLTLSQEIVRVRKEYGLIHPLVRETHYPGGYAVPIDDLTVESRWINDKQVSPYQYDANPAVVSFTWHQLECRFARTYLAESLMSDNFKELLAPAMAESYGRAMDTAILTGNGTVQPLGILKDPRIKDQTLNANTGKALIVEASADDMADWTFWTKILYTNGFNRLYRADGTWLFGDATWGTYIETLKDDVNRPIANFNPMDENAPMKIKGNRVVTLPNSLLGDFDAASAGDVVAIFGNLRNYALNFQPGLPLNTVEWDDHETNTHKTKVLTAVDGKVIDDNGWVIVTKKASA